MNLKKRLNKIKYFYNLSVALAKAEFKLRNEGSYLGILWYLLNPILTFIVLFVVFSSSFGNKIPNYTIYLLIGIIIFNFFQQTTTSSITNMRDHRLIIKSIKFPRESLVASTLFRNLFSHMFEIAILIIILLFYGITIKNMIFYLPIMFFFSIFVYGISLILASLYVYFADLDGIWQFFSRLLIFVTPVFYAVEGMTKIFILNLFNPLYYFITIARDLVIYSKIPPSWMILGAIVYSIIFFIAGILIFNKLKIKFAERL
ncbi:MAG: ABC transporter permease [Nanoarchaeota archaeon]|nr:ABC transporter permease [Nanoarchaeota archaeon]